MVFYSLYLANIQEISYERHEFSLHTTKVYTIIISNLVMPIKQVTFYGTSSNMTAAVEEKFTQTLLSEESIISMDLPARELLIPAKKRQNEGQVLLVLP